MFNWIPKLRHRFGEINPLPTIFAPLVPDQPLAPQNANRCADILGDVCLCLCAVLLIQSLKLFYFTGIPKVSLHIINMLVHIACFSTAFFLSKLHRFELARLLLVSSFTTYLIIAIVLWEINVNIQFYFLLGMFAVLCFYRPHESKKMWITLCVFCGLFLYFQNVYAFSYTFRNWQAHIVSTNTIALSASCLLMAVWLERQMNRYWQTIQKNERVSRQLLLKVLPPHITNYLMSAKQLHINQCINEHPFCTVIFIDFTKFTPFSRQTTDRDLVLFLHRIFACFDKVSEQHLVTKIKTNGDQYIAGIGFSNEKLSAYETSQRCCEFALAIGREFEIQADVDIGIKIGIASGNAISGIIGDLRPVFDVWGNTMNLAARLESSANDREIQVCQQTMLYSMQNYRFCAGSSILLKGLGHVTVYKLLGEK